MADDMSNLVSKEERAELRERFCHMAIADSTILRLLATLDEKDGEIALLRQGIDELSEKAWRYDQLAR